MGLPYRAMRGIPRHDRAIPDAGPEIDRPIEADLEATREQPDEPDPAISVTRAPQSVAARSAPIT